MSDWFEQIPIEDLKKRKQNMGTVNLPKWNPKFIWILIPILILLAVFIFKPWYTVEADEVGVVMRFGNYNRTVTPGFHFRLPRPIETVETPNVQQVRRVEIGFQTVDQSSQQFREIPQESQMLTGDENVVIAEVAVQYRVSDPVDYLFNVADVHNTLKDVSEAALRQVVGDYAIDAALTWGRAEIVGEMKDIIQDVANEYGMGVIITEVLLQETHAPEPVEPAFLAVVSSREDQSRFINEADSYRNSEIPKAEGEVRSILEEAEAYRVERISKAKGDIERFSSILKEYREAPEIMRTRLYMETMEKVLVGKPKMINGSSSDLFKMLNVSPSDVGFNMNQGGQTNE